MKNIVRRGTGNVLKRMSQTISHAFPFPVEDLATPALLIDLDTFEYNLEVMDSELLKIPDVSLRPHGKTHKCLEVANQQISRGAVGLCTQTITELEYFVIGGVKNVLLSNQIVTRREIEEFCRIRETFGDAELALCVDCVGNVEDIQSVASSRGNDVEIECLIELNIGHNRCGVDNAEDMLEIYEKIENCSHLTFKGIQAYHGSNQHCYNYDDRYDNCKQGVEKLKEYLNVLSSHNGLEVTTITGGGTGDFQILREVAGDVYTEFQAGSYPFMDIDYSSVDRLPFKNSLFVLSSVISVHEERVVLDCGSKRISFDSGFPKVIRMEEFRGGEFLHELPFDEELQYNGGGDEHGKFLGSDFGLKIKDQVVLVPSHCDPTFNKYKSVFGVRDGSVLCEWNVHAAL